MNCLALHCFKILDSLKLNLNLNLNLSRKSADPLYDFIPKQFHHSHTLLS